MFISVCNKLTYVKNDKYLSYPASHAIFPLSFWPILLNHYNTPFYEAFNIKGETSTPVFAEDLGLEVKEPFVIIPKKQF